MGDRRAFARIDVHLPTAMFLYQIDITHSCIITNLSRGGCFIPLDQEVSAKGRCHLTLSAGVGLEATTVSLMGTIVRTTATGIGIAFLHPSSEAIALIDRVIESATSGIVNAPAI